MTLGLIDVHSHIVPESYRLKAIDAGVLVPDGMPAWPNWTVAKHLQMMDDNGIALAILSVSAPGVAFLDGEEANEMARELNDIASNACTAHPDRFLFFATLPLPHLENSLAELSRASTLPGFAGVVMLSNTRGVYAGSKVLSPIMERLNDLQCLVLLHPGSPPGAPQTCDNVPLPGMEYLFDSARAYVSLHENEVVHRYPCIKFIGTHSGGVFPLLVDRLDLFRRVIPNMISRPIAGTIKKMWFDIAGTPMPRALPILQDFVCTEHILYGSDYCFTPSLGAGLALAGLATDKSTNWTAVTSENARSLLVHNINIFLEPSLFRWIRHRILKFFFSIFTK